MPRWICYPAIFASALLLCAVPTVSAQVCQHCGCQECHQVCRLVLEEKQVDVICWGCKCEDFCLPCHSKEFCKHCEMVCDGESCNCHGGVKAKAKAKVKKFVWREWCPSCAKMFTKKKLMKRIVTKKIPTYKWVVEDVCDACDAKCGGAALSPDGEIPPPPPVASGALRYTLAPSANSPPVR